MITPSTGIRSPGRISISSPTLKSLLAMVTKLPSLLTLTLSGMSLESAMRAVLVLALARASKYFPKLIKQRIIPVDSK